MIVVTGATGHIGSELVRLLSEKNVSVRALTRDLRGLRPTRGVDWVALFSDDAGWEVLREGMLQSYAEDCEFAWVALGQRLEERGADGLRAGWLDWLEPWSEYRSEVEEIRALDDDRVIVHVRQFGTRHDGGPTVDSAGQRVNHSGIAPLAAKRQLTVGCP